MGEHAIRELIDEVKCVGGARRPPDGAVRLRLGPQHGRRDLAPARGEGQGTPRHRPDGQHGYIQLNQTGPWRELDGECASIQTVHPFLSDPSARSALAVLVDRSGIQSEIWGRQADTTANFMNRPPFVSPNARWEFSVEKANALLDAGGWKRGPDGIRAKDGKRLKGLFQAVSQPIRQKVQSIVKQACARAGIECELKSTVGLVYFSSDPGNPDTESHFYADLELSSKILRQPDPQAFMRAFCSWEVAQKSNKWAGANLARWRNEPWRRPGSRPGQRRWKYPRRCER